MLHLKANDGTELRLDVLGYQFASADDDWLIVSGTVTCARGTWSFRDPSLTTFELKELADWFRQLATPSEKSEISFTEPNLRFGYVEEAGDTALRVSFAQENSPPWVTEDERYGLGYPLKLPCTAQDLETAAAALDEMLTRFPIRAI